jgi:hypothetical protein
VQALLGPWREVESAKARGRWGGLNAIDIVLLHLASGADVVIDVRGTGGHRGEIYITVGQISHAQTGKLSGEDALREILSWPELI